MAGILKRLWAKLTQAKAPAEPSEDWTTVGRTFEPSDTIGREGPNYVAPTDEGRPPH